MNPDIEYMGKVSITVEDYSPEKEFDELTITSDMELGICCISRCPVPAGVPLTDTRFWMLINRFPDDTMVNYRNLLNKISDLESRVEILEQKVG